MARAVGKPLRIGHWNRTQELSVSLRPLQRSIALLEAPPDDVSANWFIGTPPECRFGCHLLIAELLAELWTKYDIDRMPVH